MVIIRHKRLYALHTKLKLLHVIQNKELRACCKAPYYIRKEHIRADLGNFSLINEFILNTSSKFFDSASSHPNPEVRKKINYDSQ